MKTQSGNREILVYADWRDLKKPMQMGSLHVDQLRGKEVFSFSYSTDWLENSVALLLDPDLGFYDGPQYNSKGKPNFGLFLDSSPDRWGRVLMQRREQLKAMKEKRKPVTLLESDYLLGVSDQYRMGALRFKLSEDGPFQNEDIALAAPPVASLRTLEEASLHLEDDNAISDPAFAQWLNMLISPGSSLGGARPKASVIDPKGQLWIAKFPSKRDDRNIGGWEWVVNELARKAGLNVAEGQIKKLTKEHHTYLSKRFDRVGDSRTHFASAMTLLGRNDGADAAAGASYLEIMDFLASNGGNATADMRELWMRIVFNICISNSDDHLRNHGFLLTAKGWILSPAYDINPVPFSNGLSLNIDRYSNLLDLELALEVAEKFRVSHKDAKSLISKMKKVVAAWQKTASGIGIPRNEIAAMQPAFAV
ncbi:type II toxin-antitoxin system HipA family toxin [Pseudobacter ginsenosidimutans]|uniref:Serine/threonine-protein kinase HipA n=1 Tax=Pseudobacter ginsenosidimutans TaxID=661488 RepID=A0A4Q7MU27_9BACT|nr:HipA domain-containing protein [Pseudobacter ginsenosidimutans]QEC41754.1 HipA domain-containing protein [Pseudobacter ginsenosidimutans]RZS71439.1 serine/threonine-protein kinase HipA [Pseudobacter ginsenosidimutans]